MNLIESCAVSAGASVAFAVNPFAGLDPCFAAEISERARKLALPGARYTPRAQLSGAPSRRSDRDYGAQRIPAPRLAGETTELSLRTVLKPVSVLWHVARYAAGEAPVVVAPQWGDDEGEGDSPDSGNAIRL